MPQAGRRTRSAFAVEPKIFLIEDGFEKLALPLRNEVGGSGRAPFFTKDSRVYITRLSFKATNVKLCKKV